MYLIGLNGRLHSGKDTAFDTLNSLFGGRYVFQRVAFADKLKLSGMAALGLTQGSDEDTIELANRLKEFATLTVSGVGNPNGMHAAEFSSELIEEHAVTGREFWQKYGKEGHRDLFGTNFWVNALLPRPVTLSSADRGLNNQSNLRYAFPGVGVLVITDCRFPNEAERIIELGGEIWLMDADERLAPLPDDAHASERPLDSKYIARKVDCNGTPARQAISLTDQFTRMEIDHADAR